MKKSMEIRHEVVGRRTELSALIAVSRSAFEVLLKLKGFLQLPLL